jgi:holliday junction DNA helicase RuvA
MMDTMIGSLKGKITLRTEKFVLVEAGGVGYKANVSPDTLSRTSSNEEVFLFIHTHVREDAFELFGFQTIEELNFFELLIGISGIGPRSALAILGIAPLPTLKRAVATGDTSYLTKISGIGKKTAEKIVLELRDKVGVTEEGMSLQGELDVMEALQALGYSQNEAREALKKVSTENNTNIKIKEALKILGGK